MKKFSISIPNISRPMAEKFISVVSFLCIFLFLYTAFSKIKDHASFAAGISRVEIIGAYAELIAWLVPLSEIAIAVLLLFPQTLKLGLKLFIGLMALFTIYLVSVLLFSANMPCHCGGVIQRMSWGDHLWFNGVFILLAYLAIKADE